MTSSTQTLAAEVGLSFKPYGLTTRLGGTFRSVSFPGAHNVAFCRTIIDARDDLEDFFFYQRPKFSGTMFFLGELLVHAIGAGKMRPEVYDPTKQPYGINIRLLRRGWVRYFGKTRMFAVTYVVNPTKLLKYIATSEGRWRAEKYLSHRWDSIVLEAREQAKKKQEIRKLHRALLSCPSKFLEFLTAYPGRRIAQLQLESKNGMKLAREEKENDPAMGVGGLLILGRLPVESIHNLDGHNVKIRTRNLRLT